MEQEMTVQELIDLINSQKGEFVIRVICAGGPEDGENKGDRKS